jgi:hypothetical protein
MLSRDPFTPWLAVMLTSLLLALSASRTGADTIQSSVYNVTDLGVYNPLSQSPQYGVNSAGVGYVTDTSGNPVSPFIQTAVDYPAGTQLSTLYPGASASSLFLASASNAGYAVGSLEGQYPYILNLQTGQGQDPRVSDYENWIHALPSDHGALNDINQSGVAVGWAANTYTVLNGAYFPGIQSGGPLVQIQHAAIMNVLTGTVSDLNTLVQILQPNGTAWLLEDALKIDDQGRIVVVGVPTESPGTTIPDEGAQPQAFLLTPIGISSEFPAPEPSTLALFGLILVATGVRQVLRRGACDQH